MPEVCEELWNKLDDVHERGHDWNLNQLRKSLECFAKLSQTEHRFCIFIDGLDEFDGDHLDMVQTLLRLSDSFHLKLCIASRPWNVFETGFGQSEQCKIYMQDLNNQDILKFTRSRLQGQLWNRWAHSVTTEERETLVTSVTDRAEGVFLWVFLVTRYLREGLDNGDTFSNLQAMLMTFPPELEPFFKQILDSIAPVYHSRMAEFLRLSIIAGEPLNFMVLHFHDMEHDQIDFVARQAVTRLSADDAARLRRRMAMRLNGLCKGLLEIDKWDEVQFIHRTVQDWLKSGPMKTYLKCKIRAHWNGTISLLKGLLGWYKCPMDLNESSVPLSSALRYGDLICKYNDENGNTTINRILDEFLSVTARLFGLGFDLADELDDELCTSENSAYMVAFQLLSLKAGLWDYLSQKLDEEPTFLDGLARQRFYLSLDQRTWSDRQENVRSKVATSFLASYLRQDVIDLTTDPGQSTFSLMYDPRQEISRTISDFLDMGAEPTPSQKLIGLRSRTLLGCLVQHFLMDDDDFDLSKWKDYFITRLRLEPLILKGYNMIDAPWDSLCAEVSKLRDRSKEANLAPAVEFLRCVIFDLSRAISSQTQDPDDSYGCRWAELKTAIEQGFSGRMNCEGGYLIKQMVLHRLVSVKNANVQDPQNFESLDGELGLMQKESVRGSQKRAITDGQATHTPRKRARAFSFSHILCP